MCIRDRYYTVTSRMLRYVFESSAKIRFYYDESNKIYDSRTNLIVKDEIKVLNINPIPKNSNDTSSYKSDLVWEISKSYRGLDGYKDSKKIEVTFADVNEDGVVDDPEIFDKIVFPESTDLRPLERYIVQEKYLIEDGQEDYRYIYNDSVSQGPVIILSVEADVYTYSQLGLTYWPEGQYFYFVATDVVKQLLNGKLVASLDYRVFVGRDLVKFQYIHSADYETRIDPGVSNIIDVFVLTKTYDTQFRQWLVGSRVYEPLAPSSDTLYNLLSPSLNLIKSISDEIIYHPVKYRVLFGEKANPDVQAVFRVVKNSSTVISDNEIKTNILIAINEFFALENWDFGDTFYFSEMATYVMNNLAPSITSFVIVPKSGNLSFGSLFEIKAEPDQIFINGATVDNIEIISGITSSNIKTTGNATVPLTALVQQTITSAPSEE